MTTKDTKKELQLTKKSQDSKKVKKIRCWLAVWPDKSKQVLFKRLKVGSRPSGLEVLEAVIHINPSK